MPVLEIVKYGNPVLIQRADEIEAIDQIIIQLAQDMTLTMHAAPGLGLAAPQVNRGIRLITVDISVGENEKELIVLANPEILSQEGEQIEEEGCLSVPDIQEKVVRPAQVIVRGIDLNGKERRIEAEGLLARVFCHEVDHINGKLFFDNLSPLKRSLIKRALRKRLNEV